MKYRIKPNLIEKLKELNFEYRGYEEKLIGQIIEENPSVMATLETYMSLDLNTFIAGEVDSAELRGTFMIPRECLEVKYDLELEYDNTKHLC